MRKGQAEEQGAEKRWESKEEKNERKEKRNRERGSRKRKTDKKKNKQGENMESMKQRKEENRNQEKGKEREKKERRKGEIFNECKRTSILESFRVSCIGETSSSLPVREILRSPVVPDMASMCCGAPLSDVLVKI